MDGVRPIGGLVEPNEIGRDEAGASGGEPRGPRGRNERSVVSVVRPLVVAGVLGPDDGGFTGGELQVVSSQGFLEVRRANPVEGSFVGHVEDPSTKAELPEGELVDGPALLVKVIGGVDVRSRMLAQEH